MTRERHMTAFYLETILMVVIFVLVIAVLAQVFGQARMESLQAKQQTTAVCLAQNAAEAVAAADSQEALALLLDEKGNVVTDAAMTTAYYDSKMQPLTAEAAGAEETSLRVEVTWEQDDSGAGSYVTSEITVYSASEREPLYTLNTGKYLRQEKTAAQTPQEQEVAQ